MNEYILALLCKKSLAPPALMVWDVPLGFSVLGQAIFSHLI